MEIGYHVALDTTQLVLLEDNIEEGILYETELTRPTKSYSLWIEPTTGNIYILLNIMGKYYLSYYNPK
jgi:hypothetical protein